MYMKMLEIRFVYVMCFGVVTGMLSRPRKIVRKEAKLEGYNEILPSDLYVFEEDCGVGFIDEHIFNALYDVLF